MKTRRKPLTKIQKSARGETCDLRDWAVCNHNPETTVYCHTGSGTNKRNPEYEALNGVYGCSTCHDAIDRRSKRFLSDNPDNQHTLNLHRNALIQKGKERTQAKLKAKGLMP